MNRKQIDDHTEIINLELTDVGTQTDNTPFGAGSSMDWIALDSTEDKVPTADAEVQTMWQLTEREKIHAFFAAPSSPNE